MDHHLLQTDNEITRKVLLYCLKGPVILPPSPTEERRCLSQTCSAWRKIILSGTYASLWSTIFFSPGPFSNIQKLVTLSQHAIFRAKPHILHLDFIGDLPEILRQIKNSTTSEDLLYGRCQLSVMRAIVLPNMSQIGSLRLLICTQEDFIELQNIQGHLFPSLSVLDIAVPPSLVGRLSASLQASRTTRGIDTFPNIRQLSLRLLSHHSFNPLSMSHLPWSQLTDVNFGSILLPSNVFAGIMRRTSSSLIKGTFRVQFERKAHNILQPNFGFVNMPAMISLQMTLHNPSQDPRLFSILNLPILKSLQINIIDEYESTCNIGMFIPIVKKSTDTLEVLKFMQAHSPPELQITSRYPPYIPPFRHLPTPFYILDGLFKGLNHLGILSLPRGMLLPSLIIQKIAHGEILPCLQILETTVTDGWKGIIDMIYQRNALAKYHLLRPGCSSPSFAHTNVSALIHVRMFMTGPIFEKQSNLVEELKLLEGLASIGYLLDDAKIYHA